jgi:hypothetical protein
MSTAGMDQSADAVHPGGLSIPMNRRNALIGPYSGLNRRFQTYVRATMDVMYGKNAAVGRTPPRAACG